MKKLILIACSVVLLLFAGYYAYYHYGVYLDIDPDALVTTFMTADENAIYMQRGTQKTPFEIRGVDLGMSVPGEWATDYAIDEQTYLRWFGMIQEMGANTIRVYTILQDDFYQAFYRYNLQREEQGLEPLWLIHGVWIDDYAANSHRDAYDGEILETFLDDCRSMVDVIHGQRVLSLGRGLGSGSYRQDISRWVIGYILGIEWNTDLVVYTNQMNEGASFSGSYLYATEDASPFECMLAQVGNEVIDYETRRYKQQRLLAFANSPATDPFLYPVAVTDYQGKMACVDVEHIRSTDAFLSGQFASYHVYPSYPDYLEAMREAAQYTEDELRERMKGSNYELVKYRLSQMDAPHIEDYLQETDYEDDTGRVNTYRAYLTALNRYHTVPVVISEYGISTGRGMSQLDRTTGRNQGKISEEEQGKFLIECYEDIMSAGSAGSCIAFWQDEWHKRTWNTLYAVDRDYTPYWSDYQTSGQFFGLLTFDPGQQQSVCYVDGDTSEWGEEDVVVQSGSAELSMKYDEKFLYFYARAEGFDYRTDSLYIPIDLTPKTGSTYCENFDLSFERACDFLIRIDGKQNSRVLVQERYEALMSTYGMDFYLINPYVSVPDQDSPVFKRIEMVLSLESVVPPLEERAVTGEKYETGKLLYGNANPDSDEFHSLADFIFTEDGVEIRIPWQLLNFSNPSEMMIHDDYYECYGVENLEIDRMYVGLTDGAADARVPMKAFQLEGWGEDVTYHERLKDAYYELKDYWTGA